MGVESVPVAEALSHADTLEISCYSPIGVLLPALESMESKDIQAIEAIQRMFTFKIVEVQHLKYFERLHELVLSPKTSWTLYNYIHLEDNTAYGAKCWWHNGAQNKNQKSPKTGNTAQVSIQQTETQHNPLKKMQWLYLGLVCTIRCENILETSKVLKLKNSYLSSTNFCSSFLMSQKCPTMSPHQSATASSTSSLTWGLKEFTKVVESQTRPWSSLSCFKTTPSIQVYWLSGVVCWWLCVCVSDVTWLPLLGVGRKSPPWCR